METITEKSEKLTPLMRQFWSIKKDHHDKILLFRMGDFYEMFYDDAVTAAPILNIALTARNKKAEDETPMCGVPYHSVATPIAKLLAAGLKVAICEQLEDPAEAKGIVKRGVTRTLSPGMVYDPDTLSELDANYLASFDERYISFLDATTGESFFYDYQNLQDLAALFELLRPIEVVLSSGQRNKCGAIIPATAHLTVSDSLENLWPERLNKLPESAARLLTYAVKMQGTEILSTIRNFEKRSRKDFLNLSPTTVGHLELLKTYRGEAKGSLFFAINRSKTAAGARLLKQWLQFPLTDIQKIHGRLDRVQKWAADLSALKAVREELKGLGDIERRLSKIAYSSCHPRDLLALKDTLGVGLRLSRFIQSVDPADISAGEKIFKLIERGVSDSPPAQLKNGGYIKLGFSPDLDEYIELTDDSQQKLLKMEAREKERTGISSLKVRYNNVFGYYIEITNTHKDKVPPEYKRKQTLANAERYVTYELEELEQKVLAARVKRVELEAELFTQIKKEVLSESRVLMRLAAAWSELDVITALAWVAVEMNFVRPQVLPGGDLVIKSSRHPVVEQEVKTAFVPNHIHIQPKECLLLTGPNMAGKSTLMRQVAITIILAQMGSFVPATEAKIPIYENIFTRIGASDSLSEGLSTFMVEMKETAELLRALDDKSLVILDEIGRGTSTYDGMSLAQAILEHIVLKTGATSLFATHYHELTELEQKYPQIKNAHMSIEERHKNEIRFTYMLTKGPASKSYGIHVAELAGLPKSITQRAAQILKSHELGSNTKQLSLLDLASVETEAAIEPWAERIKNLSLNSMTPLAALNTISQWQQELSSQKKS
jgi:DNA mismatch repair protein MutS